MTWFLKSQPEHMTYRRMGWSCAPWGDVAHFDECVWSLTTISTSNFYMNFDFTVVKQIIVVNVSITLTVKGNRLFCGTAFKIDVKKSHFSYWKSLGWKRWKLIIESYKNLVTWSSTTCYSTGMFIFSKSLKLKFWQCFS